MAMVPIMIAMMVASAAVSAYGAIQAGNAQAAAAERAAQIDEYNMKVADQDRQQDVQTARIAAEDQSRDNRRQLASLRAIYGSSGVELAGSPLDVLTDTSIEMALDTRRTEYEGQVRNREGASKILGLKLDAEEKRMAGANAVAASRLQAVGGLLSTGGKIAGYGASRGWG